MAKNSSAKFPLIPLRGITVFPNMIASFAIGREKSMDALERAMEEDETVFLVSQKDPKTTEPSRQDLYDMGTISKVKQVLRLPGNITHIIVEGIRRAKMLHIEEEEKCSFADVMELEQEFDGKINADIEAMMRLATDIFEEYTKINAKSNGEPIMQTLGSNKPGQMADAIASGLFLSPEQKQELLEMIDPIARLKKTVELLNHEMSVLRLKKDLEEKVKKRIDQSQKEYFLREQMKVIQEELGDKDGIQADAEQFRTRLSQSGIPKETAETLEKEINRMTKMPLSSPEFNVLRNYIDYILSLPWKQKTKEKFEIKKAEKILNADHYGMEKVKERIIEFLAVRQNTNSLHSPIICLAGPPGVGKTSIAKSIAKALNRHYVRMSLGGVKDEAEIRGHRKTYVGAMPGRIINAMKQAQTINPLMLLDEVDKLSTSYNGDPASALLEVLDTEQNNTFRDHYLEMPYDLSQVLFICTANSLDTIPPALRDRMEIIMLSSYTSEEKKNIAFKHLYPKQLKLHGLKKSQLKISEKGMEELISCYTKEAGVRQLERVIGELCRKAVKKILLDETKNLSVTADRLESLLGRKKYFYDEMEQKPQVGVVRGLAWTQAGGDTLSIEVNIMEGSGKLELTGNMGDVMKESAKAAVSYIRSRSSQFKLEPDFYKEKDIHIHIPEGAVPKDGPSAGITMATAILSALTECKVKNDVAMTGEITIRGRVLPIGGLKEKILAAKRAGIKSIILPHHNEKDLVEIPKTVKEGLKFVLASEMKDVLDYAIVEGETVWK